LDPVIALPTYNAYNGDPDYVLRKAYCQAIEAAGGVPLLVPLLEGERALRRLYDLSDGLLLCGGGDVAAEHYGVVGEGKVKRVDRERDRVEMLLARWALREGMPILGICRGIQSLNVAAGGTLIRDIPTEAPDAVTHSCSEKQAHEVTIKEGTLLAKALGLLPILPSPHKSSAGRIGKADSHEQRITVNSHHHQAVQRVAPGLTVSAHAPDGITEAIERAPHSARYPPFFILGVQWHPERLVPDDPLMVHLFQYYVDACRR
jgi:putative glutamine amidotransferase